MAEVMESSDAAEEVSVNTVQEDFFGKFGEVNRISVSDDVLSGPMLQPEFELFRRWWRH